MVKGWIEFKEIRIILVSFIQWILFWIRTALVFWAFCEMSIWLEKSDQIHPKGSLLDNSKSPKELLQKSLWPYRLELLCAIQKNFSEKTISHSFNSQPASIRRIRWFCYPLPAHLKSTLRNDYRNYSLRESLERSFWLCWSKGYYSRSITPLHWLSTRRFRGSSDQKSFQQLLRWSFRKAVELLQKSSPEITSRNC